MLKSQHTVDSNRLKQYNRNIFGRNENEIPFHRLYVFLADNQYFVCFDTMTLTLEGVFHNLGKAVFFFVFFLPAFMKRARACWTTG